MSRELIIYCDESDISGKHFSNFYGGVLVESVHLAEVTERLTSKRQELNLTGEVKWQKIGEAYADKYIAFAEEIFALLDEGKLKMRIMFTQNYFAAAGLTKEQREDGFFRLYYQFVKHAFGLRYAGTERQQTRVRMYFDKLPDSREKCAKFKGYVLGLNANPAFARAGIVLAEDQVAEIDSKEHVILQSLDVVLGAMQFRLNDKHREIPPGQRIRGKRTKAKELVYKRVNALIRELVGYPFNIGVSTGIDGNHANTWHHPYRHWLFMAAEVEIKPEYGKRNEKRPAATT